MRWSDPKAASDWGMNTPLPYHAVQGIRCVLITEELYKNEGGCMSGREYHLLLQHCRRKKKKKKRQVSTSFFKCLDYKVPLEKKISLRPPASPTVLEFVPEEWCLIPLWVPHQIASCSLTAQGVYFDSTGLGCFYLILGAQLSSGFLSAGDKAPANSEEHLASGIAIIGLDFSASAIEGA